MHKFLKLGLLPIVFIACSNLLSCNMIKKEVALITDVGDIDDGSFNQASWEAIKDYCTDNKHPHSYDYYRPFADSDYARRCAIKQAVYKGAQVVVCPGFKFAYTVGVCQSEFPNVHFILLDSDTHNNDDAQTPIPIKMNTVCVCFQSELSGYLTGYAVAKDYLETDVSPLHGVPRGRYEYGFCGGDNAPGVYPYGFGFIQGIVAATSEFCKGRYDLPRIDIRYNYAKVFAQSPDAAARVTGWYGSGVKAVFACGGKLYQSITEGVKDYNRKNNYYNFEEGDANREAARWIGVDSDQYAGLKDAHEKKTIITSALKRLDEAIKTALNYHYLGVWDVVIGGPKRYGLDGQELEREWTLGLGSIFGRPDDGEHTPPRYVLEPKNYVGIPTATTDGSDNPDAVLRGFKKFTKKQYDDEIEKCRIRLSNDDYFVYNGDGNNLWKYTTDGHYKQIINDPASPDPMFSSGIPEFMNIENDDVYNARYVAIKVEGEDRYITFREKYLCDYPRQNLHITYIP